MTFEEWWNSPDADMALCEWEDAQRAFSAGLSAGRAEAKGAVAELWSAMRATAQASPLQYITFALIEVSGSPGEFIRRAIASGIERTRGTPG